MPNTKAFIIALRTRVNAILTTYYDEAPSNGASFPYAVISGVNVSDLAMGDLALFYIDVWTDESLPDAGEQLEEYCDTLRRELSGAVLSVPGVFGAHIGFEKQSPVPESEYDIAHRKLSMSARIFYN